MGDISTEGDREGLPYTWPGKGGPCSCLVQRAETKHNIEQPLIPTHPTGETMPLDRSDVEHIAALARIGLTEAELVTFQEQLSDILDQFELLKQLDTSSVMPTGHAVEVNSVMRDDVPDEPLSPEDTLRNAPRREEDFFRVKAVLEE